MGTTIIEETLILLLNQIFEAICLTGRHRRNIQHRGRHHSHKQATDELTALQIAFVIHQRHNKWNKEHTLHQIDETVVQQEHVDNLAQAPTHQDR